MLSGLPLMAYSQSGAIRINQMGYYPTSNKMAIVVYPRATTFEVVNALDGSVEFTGYMSPLVYWADAGDSVRICDFTALVKTGRFKIRIPGFGESHLFEISSTVLRKAAYASLKSYYYQRCSYELTEPFAGLWARPSGHPDTTCIFHSSTGKSGEMSSPGGWYDAGDYGKYVVNAGISVATILSFHENFSSFFGDSSILIPESGNGFSDLLDEVKYELDWLKTMQDEDGGVFHKLTTLNFAGFVMPHQTNSTRYVIGKSTAAALDFAAMMSMAGRIYQEYDPGYANDCISRAMNAWKWARENPAVYFQNPADVSTGAYGDGNVSDEFIWAAAELFITTGEDEYKTYLESKSSSLTYKSEPGWPNVQPLASLSLATRANGLSEALLNHIKNSIITTSDNWLKQIETSACRIPGFGYYWGSNSGIANMGVGMLYAHILTGNEKYIRGAAECADYLLGKNATGFSFQSSYGSQTPLNFHHRPSGSDGITQPVPGFLAGGPNKNQEDGQKYPFSNPAKSYVDVLGSYASNEICINWNAPFTALLAGVDAILGEPSEVRFEVQTSANNPPAFTGVSPRYDARLGSDQPIIINGTASDPDNISKVELYINERFTGISDSGEFEWTLDPLPFGSHTMTILAYDHFGLASELTNLFSYNHVHIVPGKVEAEDYSKMSGIQTGTTSDTGGGLNVTSIETGDWFDYSLSVAESGDYCVEYRISSISGEGKLELKKISQAILSSMIIESTGDDQNWTTLSDTISLATGSQTLRVYAASGGWNLNWINFVKLDPVSINQESSSFSGNYLSVHPNPVTDNLTVSYFVTDPSPVEFNLYDSQGKLTDKKIKREVISDGATFDWIFEDRPAAGLYFLTMHQSNQEMISLKILISQ